LANTKNQYIHTEKIVAPAGLNLKVSMWAASKRNGKSWPPTPIHTSAGAWMKSCLELEFGFSVGVGIY